MRKKILVLVAVLAIAFGAICSVGCSGTNSSSETSETNSTSETSEANTAESKYDNAVALMDKGEYAEAYAAFCELDDYKNSVEQSEICKSLLYKDAEVGDYVFYGSYEQDNNTANGNEDIEWLVLAKEDNSILVTSKYALDCKQYNTNTEAVTWETCSLRAWLNGDFYNEAFNAEQQASIAETTVTADNNPNYNTDPGNDTLDKIFLLSISEAEKYFATDEDRKCVPTDYTIAQGAYTSSKYQVGDKATCSWWLRSPGRSVDSAVPVPGGGSVFYIGGYVYIDYITVRPAMWITLN